MPTDKFVCVIPARGGSKGIPGKNLVDLGGRPLLAWTIESAVRSGIFEQVVVSTETAEIAQIAIQYGAKAPFVRPFDLAEDQVHAVHVVLHALDWLEENGDELPKGIMMLLPTCPFRRPEDIQGAAALFDDHQADSVVGVVDLGKHLTNLRFLRGNTLEVAVSGHAPNEQRQGNDKLYSVNGSIFLARPDILRRYGTFHVDGALGYVMEQLNSIDIDEPSDLDLARRLCEFMAEAPAGGSTCHSKN